MQAARSLVNSSAGRSLCAGSVPDDISNAVHGSNIWWRGRSFAASVPFDSSKCQRAKKKLSRHERYSLIKSFIDRYRDTNAGKFPSITIVKKECGGSHYTVREILQRIEHEYCKQSVDKKIEAAADRTKKQILSQIDAKKESLVSTKLKVNLDSLTEAGKCDSILETGTAGKVHDHKMLDESSEHILVDSTGVSAYIPIDGTEKQAASISKASSKEDPAVHRSAVRTGTKGAQPFDVIRSSKSDEIAAKGLDYSSESQGETSKSMAPKEESPPKSSTIWGRVKSLADGFISFWKKM